MFFIAPSFNSWWRSVQTTETSWVTKILSHWHFIAFCSGVQNIGTLAQTADKLTSIFSSVIPADSPHVRSGRTSSRRTWTSCFRMNTIRQIADILTLFVGLVGWSCKRGNTYARPMERSPQRRRRRFGWSFPIFTIMNPASPRISKSITRLDTDCAAIVERNCGVSCKRTPSP